MQRWRPNSVPSHDKTVLHLTKPDLAKDKTQGKMKLLHLSCYAMNSVCTEFQGSHTNLILASAIWAWYLLSPLSEFVLVNVKKIKPDLCATIGDFLLMFRGWNLWSKGQKNKKNSNDYDRLLANPSCRLEPNNTNK